MRGLKDPIRTEEQARRELGLPLRVVLVTTTYTPPVLPREGEPVGAIPKGGTLADMVPLTKGNHQDHTNTSRP